MLPLRPFPALLLIIFMFSQSGFSQESSPARPKIGYVLSGGGAKGMAHVGVLKVLEEVGLEPDFITGTSMGSIMGGLYSIGYSADEISHVIETVDWSKVLTNEIPSDLVLMRRKHEYKRFILELPIYNGKPELPAGLIEGQKLSELFTELSWRQAGVNDFNDFPYPFSCIGTDILQGKMVEMNSGDLASAMRASMAIPSVFTAVIRDSTHILVDGGVVRNFPVQEAIDMGADIIIGIYVGFDTKMKPEQLRSLTSVITRTSLLSGAQDVASQVPLVDYMIVPDLEGYTPSSFTSGVEIMNRGEAAARAQIDVLKALADSVNSLGAAPKRKQLPSNDSILVRDIQVLLGSPGLSDFIIARSGIETGEWIKPEQLNAGVDRLFGTLFFDKIEYYFEDLDDGYRLVFRVKEKAQSSIGAAIHYDNSFGPGLILNYKHNNLGIEGSRLGVTVDLSENSQARAYYDVHLGKKRTFIGSLFATYEREELPFTLNNVEIGNYNHIFMRLGAGFRQSLGINNHVGADFYYRYSTFKISQNIKEVVPPGYDLIKLIDNWIYTGPAFTLIYQHNSFDSNLYPTKGSMVDLKYRQAFNTNSILVPDYPDSLGLENEKIKGKVNPYWALTFDLENYLPLGKKVSFNSEFALGLSDNDKPIPDNFYVGGYRYNLRANQVAFVGLNSHELLQGNYVKGKLALQVQAMPNLYVSALANLIIVSDDITTFADDIFSWNDDARYMGVGAGFTYKTPIGPMSVFLGSRTDIWNPIWYVNIGYTF